MANNRVGKRSNGNGNDDSIKPLRKMRAISGYNLWHAEFMKTAGMCSLSSDCNMFSSMWLYRS